MVIAIWIAVWIVSIPLNIFVIVPWLAKPTRYGNVDRYVINSCFLGPLFWGVIVLIGMDYFFTKAKWPERLAEDINRKNRPPEKGDPNE